MDDEVEFDNPKDIYSLVKFDMADKYGVGVENVSDMLNINSIISAPKSISGGVVLS